MAYSANLENELKNKNSEIGLPEAQLNEPRNTSFKQNPKATESQVGEQTEKQATFRKATFTTEPRKSKSSINISRKGSIVKERCRQLTELINRYFSSGIIHDDDLTSMIFEYIGGDKETVRAYKGYKGHIRQGRCGDNKLVGHPHKGYLELFGYLRKIPGMKWQICQTKLISEDRTIESKTKEKISLFHKQSITSGKSARKPREVVSLNVLVKKEEDTEKERNVTPKIYGKLNAEELKIFSAAPSEEVDKGKTNFRKCF